MDYVEFGMALPQVCFVIPTYNEADNITPLLAQVLESMDDHGGWDFNVLVVDDDSPDGTGARVRAFASTDSRVHLLTGTRRGLGDAYLRGFEYALSKFAPDVLVQMDADFSHAPADCPRLLDALDDGTDLVIGSRYVRCGRIDADWHLFRRWLSRGGNFLTRYVARLYSVRDCTAGFKATRVAALAEIKPRRFRIQGYVFQVALLHSLVVAGARVREIPISFHGRTRGSGKLGVKEVLEFAVHVWWLRLQGRNTFSKFMLTGLSGVLVNLGSFAILLSYGMHKYLSSACAVELSIISNFLINNYWTFGYRDIPTRKRIRGLKYNMVSLATLAISLSTFVILSQLLPEGSPMLHQLLSVLPAGLVNYFANSYWTFRER